MIDVASHAFFQNVYLCIGINCSQHFSIVRNGSRYTEKINESRYHNIGFSQSFEYVIFQVLIIDKTTFVSMTCLDQYACKIEYFVGE